METGRHRGRMGDSLAVLRNANIWVFALLVTVTESYTFFCIDLAQVDAFHDVELVQSFAYIAAYALSVLAAKRLEPLLGRKSIVLSCVVAAALGVSAQCISIVLVRESAFLGGAVMLFGIVCSVAALCVLYFAAFEGIVRLDPSEVAIALVASAVVNALLQPIAVAHPALVFFAALFLSLVFSLAAIGGIRRSSKIEDDRSVAPHRQVSFPYMLALGYFFVSLGFGFLQSILYGQAEATVVAATTFTKFLALIAFFLVVRRMGDAGYSALLKITSTTSVIAFALFLAFGAGSPLASAVMAGGFSLLELTVRLLAVDMITFCGVNCVRAVAAICLADSIAYTLGGLCERATAQYADVVALVAVVFVVLLTIAAVWLFQDKQVNEFIWGKRKDEKTVEEVPFEEKLAILARACGLSPREEEVLSLFATGRSSTFIAEQFCVTTNTVRTHVKHVYEKCGVHSRQELITLVEQQRRETSLRMQR